MEADAALNVIDALKAYAAGNHAGLIIVGSVAYRNALSNPANFPSCDDLDCILVYDDISALKDFPYIDTCFFESAESALGVQCDMFATKNVIGGVKVSFDFVSLSYLHVLSGEALDGSNKYRMKLTDSVEVPDHVYCDWFGNQISYHKEQIPFSTFRIYKLPIHLYADGVFVPGVLLTKYLYNPAVILSVGAQDDYINRIQMNVARNCPKGGSMYNFFFKRYDFSDETKQFLLNLSCLEENAT